MSKIKTENHKKHFRCMKSIDDYDILYIDDFSMFPKIQSWYKAREHQGFKVMSRDLFPEIGMIIYDRKIGDFLYAGWLYQSDSSVAVLDWIVGNPIHKNNEALELLIKSLVAYAKSEKYKYIFSIFDTKGLILNKLLLKLNFKQGSKIDVFIKEI